MEVIIACYPVAVDFAVNRKVKSEDVAAIHVHLMETGDNGVNSVHAVPLAVEDNSLEAVCVITHEKHLVDKIA